MTGEHIVRARTRNIIKFNADLWSTICRFAEENYDTCGAIVETTAESKTFDNMDAAYEYICGNTESINTITVLADYKEEQLEIELKNKRDNRKYSMEVYCECIDGYREDKARKFGNRLVNLSTNRKGQIKEEIYTYAILIAASIFLFLSPNIRFEPMYMAFLIPGLYVLFAIYKIISSTGIMPLSFYGEKGLDFQIDFDVIAETTKKEKFLRIISTIALAILAALWIWKLFF